MRKTEKAPANLNPEELSEEELEELRLQRVRNSLDFHRFLASETKRRSDLLGQSDNNYYQRYDPEDFDGA